MRRLLHLSDLHFGRTRADLLEPLVAAVNATGADLVAVSGDLTQRARVEQFRAARAFLDRLTAPVLVVPGNHDVPLDNLAVRMLNPFGRYRRHITNDLAPVFRTGPLLVRGLNTVDPYAWQRGRAFGSAVASACKAFRAAPAAEAELRVIVAHHPFEQEEGVAKTPMRGATRAIRKLADCGVQVVLSGHLHAWRAAPVMRVPGAGAVLIQAGTGLSTRLRGEENDFNLITLDRGRVEVERFVARDGAAGFAPDPPVRFALGDRGWSREAARAEV